MATSTFASDGEPPGAEGLPPLDCVINPSVVADLGSSVPGVISTVRVDRSDLIQQGQVVAELESSVEVLAAELARARAEMDAEIELRRVNAAFGHRQHRRTEDLYQRKVISTNDMDERQTEARLASLQLRQAMENQQLAELERQRAEKLLHRRTIESPISGVVMERFKTVGEYVEDQPVMRVAQLDPLHVEVFVPVDRLGAVSEGMQAQVWSEAVPGTNWEASVTRVDRVADVASGTYGVRLELPNPDYKVPAGLRCRIQFASAPPEPVVTGVPTPAAEAALHATEASQVAAVPVRPAPHDEAVFDAAGDYARAAKIAAALSNAADHAAAISTPQARTTAGPAATSMMPESSLHMGRIESEVTAEDTEIAGRGPLALQSAVEVEAVPAQQPAEASPVMAVQAAEPAAEASVLPAIEPMDKEPLAEATALPRCQLAGPFDEEAVAKRRAGELRSSGLEVALEQHSVLAQEGLRVVSEKMPSRAAAKALYERMRAAGFRDLYIVTHGKYEDQVALGLYKHERPARERIAEIATKGFQAELRPWLERKTQYFLAVRGVPTARNEALLSALPLPAADGVADNGTCDQLASR